MATFPSNTKVLSSTGLTNDLNQTYGLLQTILGPAIVPSGDTTGGTDSANIASALSAYGGAQLTGGTFFISGPVSLASNQVLAGAGPGTLVKPGSSWSGTIMVQVASGSATQVTIRDITLNAGWTSGVYCVFLQPVSQNDPNNYLSNVWALNAGVDGIVVTNSGGSAGSKLVGCKALGCLGNGFQLSADVQADNCEAGFNQLHGFTLSTNSFISNCKAWFSGFNSQTSAWTTGTSCGFVVLTAASSVTITGCQAQQNGLHGYLLNGTVGSPNRYCTVTGCEADTNSAFSANIGSGFELSYAQHCTLSGCVAWNNGGLSPGSQLYGVEVTGNGNGTQISCNQVAGSNASNFYNYLSSPTGYVINNALAKPDTSTITVTAAAATAITVPYSFGPGDAQVGTTYRLTVYGLGTQGSTQQTLTFSDNLSGLSVQFPTTFVGISTGFQWKCVVDYTFSAVGAAGNVHVCIWAQAATSELVNTKFTQAVNTTVAQTLQLNAAWGAVTGAPTVSSGNSCAERIGP